MDFTMKPTKAALLFFGYLKKDYPSGFYKNFFIFEEQFGFLVCAYANA